MNILSIETSCDETSIAVLYHDTTSGMYSVLSHITLSQIDIHRQYGGVYPNAARREHQLNIVPVLHEALEKAGLLQQVQSPENLELSKIHLLSTTLQGDTMPSESVSIDSILAREAELLPILQEFVARYAKPDIDCIAVTTGPGLEPALWVGVNMARALSAVWQLPVVAVNHMEGHMFSVFATGQQFVLPTIAFPALALLISGGHTEIIEIKNWNLYTKIGATVDDAIGEAFDKVARMLGLPYPGGPEISRLAAEYELVQSPKNSELGKSNSESGPSLISPLPRPMLHSGDLNFSFSGLKTAVRYLIESLPKPLEQTTISAIAYEFEMAVTEVLVHKTKKALEQTGAETVIIGGGVASNTRIRSALHALCDAQHITLYTPKGVLAMDNALMIGVVGAMKFRDGITDNPDTLRANGNWSL